MKRSRNFVYAIALILPCIHPAWAFDRGENRVEEAYTLSKPTIEKRTLNLSNRGEWLAGDERVATLQQWQKGDGQFSLYGGEFRETSSNYPEGLDVNAIHSMQMDYEDQEVFTSARFEAVNDEDLKTRYRQEVRVGVSTLNIFEDFDAPWLLLMATRDSKDRLKMKFQPAIQLLSEDIKSELDIDRDEIRIRFTYKW